MQIDTNTVALINVKKDIIIDNLEDELKEERKKNQQLSEILKQQKEDAADQDADIPHRGD